MAGTLGKRSPKAESGGAAGTVGGISGRAFNAISSLVALNLGILLTAYLALLQANKLSDRDPARHKVEVTHRQLQQRRRLCCVLAESSDTCLM